MNFPIPSETKSVPVENNGTRQETYWYADVTEGYVKVGTDSTNSDVKVGTDCTN
jgi:hypothetical protein